MNFDLNKISFNSQKAKQKISKLTTKYQFALNMLAIFMEII
jgi:hypothetical protein